VIKDLPLNFHLFNIIVDVLDIR